MTEQVAIPGAVIAGQASPTAAAAHRVCASAQAFRLFIAIAMIRQKDYIILIYYLTNNFYNSSLRIYINVPCTFKVISYYLLLGGNNSCFF